MNRPLYKKKQSRSTLSLLWYLLYLSLKYDSNVSWLYKRLVDATISQTVLMRDLTVKYRGKDDDSHVFLLTDETDGFVSQLHIPQTMIEDDTLLKIIEHYGIPRFKSQNHREFLGLLVKTR